MYFRTFVLTVTAVGLCWGDFRYDQTSRMTGGSMMKMMQMVGRGATEPNVTTVAVKGDQMVTRGKDFMHLVDLGAETTTTVNMKDQTYSVMTFAQTKAQMEKMMAKGGAKDTNVNVDGKATGKTATVNGMATSEWFMTMIVEGGSGGQKGQMRMEMSNWISKTKVAGFDEVTTFQKKMVDKMGIASMAGQMSGPMAQPGMAKGMAEMGKKMAEMGGVPVVTVTRMIPTDPEQVKQMEAMQAQPASSGQSGAGQPSMGDALAGALGGRFGGMGRKKKDGAAPAAATEAPAAVKGAPVEGSFSGAASMMEMTIETSGYTTQGVDPGLFAVPAGFKEVKPKGL